MILEVAVLNVKPSLTDSFEAAFREAQEIIRRMDGYIDHELQKCIEVDCQYILLVRWQTLEAHTIGFRESPDYLKWKALLHHFYDPFPTVDHYESVFS